MAVNPAWQPTPAEAAAELAALAAAIAGSRALAGSLAATPNSAGMAADAAHVLARQEKHAADVRAYCTARGIDLLPQEPTP